MIIARLKIGRKIGYLYKKFGPVKFFFYMFLVVNAVIMTVGFLGMIEPYFRGEHSLNQNYLYNNLHLAADRKDTFMDFFNSIQYGRAPYTSGVIYPPFINALFGFFGRFVGDEINKYGTMAVCRSWKGLALYGCFLLLELVVCVYAISRIKNLSRGEKVFLGFGLCFTLPMVYCLERGNCILLSVALSLVFCLLYDSKDWKNRAVALFSLGAAAAIKLYPALLGLLLIRKRKWKDVLLAVGIGVLIMFVPFLLFDADNRSIILWAKNILNCVKEFANVGYGSKVDISNFISIVEAVTNLQLSSLCNLLRFFILLANSLLVVFDRKMEEWKAVTLLTLVMILVPGFSWTYTMLFIYIPVILYLEKNTSGDFFFLALFILSLAFVPTVHQFDFFKSLNEGMRYRLGWTTLMEFIAIFSMEVLLLVNYIFKKGRRR